MMSETEVMRMAQGQARQILERAEVEAAEIRKGANQYARDVVANLEQIMSGALSTIRHGQELLSSEE